MSPSSTILHQVPCILFCLFPLVKLFDDSGDGQVAQFANRPSEELIDTDAYDGSACHKSSESRARTHACRRSLMVCKRTLVSQILLVVHTRTHTFQRFIIVHVRALSFLSKFADGSWTGLLLAEANLFNLSSFVLFRVFQATFYCAMTRCAGVTVDDGVSMLGSYCRCLISSATSAMFDKVEQ